MFIEIKSEDDMKAFGQIIGGVLFGGEVIELVGDVGAGKTTLVKGIAVGLGISENVASPSFTISRVYKGRGDLTLAHYDFYRLNDAGIMEDEILETIGDAKTVTVIEWGEIIEGVLPSDRLTIRILATDETSRKLMISAGGEKSSMIQGNIKQ